MTGLAITCRNRMPGSSIWFRKQLPWLTAEMAGGFSHHQEACGCGLRRLIGQPPNRAELSGKNLEPEHVLLDVIHELHGLNGNRS